MSISVIVPVYNVEDYIMRCLSSLRAQTYRDLEIICVNDCSTDNSRQVVEQFVRDDPRFKIVDNSANLGAALSRNVGLDIAKGDYIYFIDSDDYIDDIYLEMMVAASCRSKADIVHNINVVQQNGDDSIPYVHPTMNQISDNGEWVDRVRMIHDSQVHVWARLYRHDFIKKHDLRFLDIKNCNDVVFHYLSHVFNEKSFVFHGAAYHYVSRDNSLSGLAKHGKKKDWYAVNAYSLIYDEYKNRKLLNLYPIKMFNVWPNFSVDSQSKYEAFKSYFAKIYAEHFVPFMYLYNGLDVFFLKSILKPRSYDEFCHYYSPNVILNFLKNALILKGGDNVR